MEDFNLASALETLGGAMHIPGAALMKYGPKDYTGAVIAIRGTLYFKGAWLSEVREAVCLCFEQYQTVATEHLTWLWSYKISGDGGRYKRPYRDAPSMRRMIGELRPNDLLAFGYTSGEKELDASPWLFDVMGPRAWQANMGDELGALEFSVPLLFHEQHPTIFPRLFLDFAERLKAHGHAGFALNLSLVQQSENQPMEAFMAEKIPGLDAGNNILLALGNDGDIAHRIKTVSWLTALDQDMLQQVGGLSALQTKLPADSFAFYDYGHGLAIQAGPYPSAVGADGNSKPPLYVLPNMALKNIRCTSVGDLHGGSHDGEPRLTGWSADQWLKRFDVPEEEVPMYLAKLADEPKLKPESLVVERLAR